jgi:hypothetical protein
MEMSTIVSTILSLQCSKIGFAAVLLLSLMAAACGKGNVHAAAPPPAPEVRVAPVIQQDVPVYTEWVATLDGYVNAEIRPQVSGYIIKQAYKEGSLVRKGQVLYFPQISLTATGGISELSTYQPFYRAGWAVEFWRINGTTHFRGGKNSFRRQVQ